jgi:hypothetical protein
MVCVRIHEKAIGMSSHMEGYCEIMLHVMTHISAIATNTCSACASNVTISHHHSAIYYAIPYVALILSESLLSSHSTIRRGCSHCGGPASSSISTIPWTLFAAPCCWVPEHKTSCRYRAPGCHFRIQSCAMGCRYCGGLSPYQGFL